ncbi:glycosyltransferase family 2 protein [Vogesella sp. LYT5W]|uniref:Glycosyltransferase family 2 protein n=1 Tax=Vogesella margarita TaxID=2984199 RepID=A0ABT5IQ12_9NEIS|nr:glycosyltransferase family 2 protein [Vogesella margarita]MDC7714637.1 glycosyltransferase family 2 protein [Vogesella margarita]
MLKCKTCSIIVSYNPEIDNLVSLTNALARQSDFVIIIDNNSHNKESIVSITETQDRCRSILLDKNTGIAHAQNVGIQFALDHDYAYVVFFDQDSTIDSDFIRQQVTAFEHIQSGQPQLAALGPAFVDKKHGFHYKIVNIDRYGRRTKIDTQHMKQPFAASLIISSGSLVSADALRAIGPMDERFFIDYVDTEWCLRAHAKGYVIYVNPQVQMLHAIGDNSLQLLKWRVPVHSAFRRYYRIRNAFFLLKMRHVPTLLAVREITFNLVHQLVLILFGQNKLAYVRSLWRGLRDGLNGKY